jgi:hypothetical protein
MLLLIILNGVNATDGREVQNKQSQFLASVFTDNPSYPMRSAGSFSAGKASI